MDTAPSVRPSRPTRPPRRTRPGRRRRATVVGVALLALAALVVACVPEPPAEPAPPQYINQMTDDQLDATLADLAPTIQQNFADPAIVAAIPREQRAAVGAAVAKLGTADGRAAFIPDLREATLATRAVPPLQEQIAGGTLGEGGSVPRVITNQVRPRGTRSPAPAAPPAGTTNVAVGAPAGSCGAPNGVGTVSAPADVAPGQLLTPQHDVFTTTSSSISPLQPGPLVPAGQESVPGAGPGVEFRRGPSLTSQEVHVRVNLDDPKDFGPAALWPLLSIRPIGGTQATERTVNAQVRNAQVFCYADDAGRPDRGYWDGWVTIPRTEPGFQLIVEVVENDYFFATQPVFPKDVLAQDGPQYFAGADRSTVHAGAAPVTSAQALPRAAGVFATTGPDATTNTPNVLTDTNGLATDDLESALTVLVNSKIRSAASGLSGSFAKGNYAAGIYITDVSDVNPQLSLEYVGQNEFFAPADEVAGSAGALRARVSVTGARAGLNLWFLGVPCVGASMTVDAVGRADVWADSEGSGTGLDARVDPSFGLNRADFSLSSPLDWIDPVCWAGYLLGPTAAYLAVPGAIEDGVKDAFGVNSDGKPGAVQGLLDGFDINSILPTVNVGTSAIRPVVTDIDNGWCGSYARPTGCTPDQDLFGAQGPEVTGDAALVGSLSDALGASLGGRFRNVFRPSLSTKVEDLVTSHRDINQRLAGLGAVVDPAVVNLALRHLSQGSSTTRTTNGLLDVAGVAIPSTSLTISTRPEVAPQVLGVPVDTEPVLCPDVCNPPPFPTPPSRLTVPAVVPDLRVSLSTGAGSPIQFSIAASVNAGLAFDPSKAALGPVLDSPNVDIQVVGGCQANYTTGYALSYNLCGRGAGGVGGAFTITSLLDYVANDVVLPMLTNSLGKIALPSLAGIVPGVDAGVKNIRFAQRGGYLAVYGDLGPVPRIGIAVSEVQDPQSLRFLPSNAIDVDLTVPGTTYTWTVKDGVTGLPVSTTVSPNTFGSGVQAPLTSFVETTDAFGKVKVADATLTVTQNALSITASVSFRWRPPIIQPPTCGGPVVGGFLVALKAPQSPPGPGCP